MADESVEAKVGKVEVGLDRAEKDIVCLYSNDKEHFLDLKEAGKNDAKMTAYVEGIFKTLTSIEVTLGEQKVSLADNLKKTTKTENLAVNLKATTDHLVVDVKEMKEKPQRNAETLKMLILGLLASNVFGIVWSMLTKK